MKNSVWMTGITLQRLGMERLKFLVITSIIYSEHVDKLTLLTTVSDEKASVGVKEKLHIIQAVIEGQTEALYRNANDTNRSITLDEAWSIHSLAVLQTHKAFEND